MDPLDCELKVSFKIKGIKKTGTRTKFRVNDTKEIPAAFHEAMNKSGIAMSASMPILARQTEGASGHDAN